MKHHTLAELYKALGANVMTYGGETFVIMKSQPTQSDVHVNGVLTQISLAYMQSASAFVADRVFPTVPVTKQTDLYRTYPKDAWFRDEMEQRAPGAESKRIGYTMSTTPYYCHVWSLGHTIPDQVRANADNDINFDRNGTRLLSQLGMIRKEKNWLDTYFKTGVWASDLTGVSGSPAASQFVKWSDPNSSPVKDIKDAKRAQMARSGGFIPTKLTLTQGVYDALTEHPDVIDRVKHSGGVGNENPARVSERALCALFEIEEILKITAVQNSAKEGQTASMGFMASDGALLTYSPPSPSLEMPSAGYTFAWTGLIGANEAGGRISRNWDWKTRSDVIEIDAAWAQAVIAPDMGTFFASPL